MNESESPLKKSNNEWLPLGMGLFVFGGATWFWISNAYTMHEIPSFLWAFSIAFLGTAAIRQSATVRNDYINLLAPILALSSTLGAMYAIRLEGIREMYAQRGLPEPGWWNGSEAFRHLLTKGGSTQGMLELAVMLTASISGFVCAASFIRRKDETS